MQRLFISYSRKEKEYVLSMTEKLKKRGVPIWLDVQGEQNGIPYSVKWYDAIEEAIFTSSGALIFHSEAWKASGPCNQEYECINRAGLEKFVVTFPIEDGEKMADLIADWFVSLDNPQEKNRCWVVSGGYHHSKDPKITWDLPAVGKASERRLLRREIDEAELYLEKYKEKGEPLFRQAMQDYLAAVKRKMLFASLMRFSFAALLLALFVFIAAGVKAVPEIQAEIQNHISDYSAYGIVSDTAEYDEISAMSLLTYPELADDFRTLREYVTLLDNNYPVEIRNGETLPEQESDGRYEISVTEGSPVIVIKDNETGARRSWQLNGAVRAYALDGERDLLAAVAEDTAYLYDLQTGCDMTFDYNSQLLESVAIEDSRLLAGTSQGDTVVWDIPWILEYDRQQRFTDASMRISNGQTVAAYVADGAVILNVDGTEYPVEFERDLTLLSAHTAVSRNLANVAVAATDPSGTYYVVMISVADRAVTEVTATDAHISGMDFSMDSQSLFVLDYYGSILKYSPDMELLGTQQGGGWYFQTMTVCEDGILVGQVGDSNCLYYFTEDLKGKELSVPAAYYPGIPVKQMAVADKYGFVFSANRGGNRAYGALRSGYDTGSRNLFAQLSISRPYSDASVAVSPDDEYVAYGSSDGSIVLWETSSMNPLGVLRMMPETPVAMAFTGNDTLKALGASGNIYELELPELLTETTAGDLTGQLALAAGEAKAVYQRMYELGLTYITPDGYDLGE